MKTKKNPMLEGKQLILATKPYAQEIRAKSWIHTLTTLVLFAATFAMAVLPLPLPLRIAGSLLTSLLLVRMFTIYHDYLHHAILKGSQVAKVIFTFFGFYTLNPSSIWKRSHDYHHKHNSKLATSNFGSFPILTVEAFGKLSRFEQGKYLFIRHPLTIAAGYIFAFIWGMCILSLFRNPRKHWDSAIALAMHFGIGILLWSTLGFASFCWAFLVPAIVSSAIGSYLFYAQHNFPKATFSTSEDWSYSNAALKSSSYMRMSRVMHWFTGNIGFHHIHHMNARIPFYRLPEVYQAFPEFQQAGTTSLLPMDIARCFRIKVWGPKQNRMLTLAEARDLLR